VIEWVLPAGQVRERTLGYNDTPVMPHKRVSL
jgi:hypothetical protein